MNRKKIDGATWARLYLGGFAPLSVWLAAKPTLSLCGANIFARYRAGKMLGASNTDSPHTLPINNEKRTPNLNGTRSIFCRRDAARKCCRWGVRVCNNKPASGGLCESPPQQWAQRRRTPSALRVSVGSAISNYQYNVAAFISLITSGSPLGLKGN